MSAVKTIQLDVDFFSSRRWSKALELVSWLILLIIICLVVYFMLRVISLDLHHTKQFMVAAPRLPQLFCRFSTAHALVKQEKVVERNLKYFSDFSTPTCQPTDQTFADLDIASPIVIDC